MAGEVLDDIAEGALEDVVSKQHADAVVADEPLSEAERVRDTAFLFLVRVEQSLDAVLAAFAKEPKELTRVRAPVTSIRSSGPR